MYVYQKLLSLIITIIILILIITPLELCNDGWLSPEPHRCAVKASVHDGTESLQFHLVNLQFKIESPKILFRRFNIFPKYPNKNLVVSRPPYKTELESRLPGTGTKNYP